MSDDSQRTEMTKLLSDVVREHNRLVLDSAEKLAKLRDRRVALMSELTQLGPIISETERALSTARELLELSWGHYRHHMETKPSGGDTP